jgi:hypothetical protein
MKTKCKPECRINEFLSTKNAREVIKLIERMRTGLPASALENWQPAKGTIPHCPYADMSGEKADYCENSCHIHDLLHEAAVA